MSLPSFLFAGVIKSGTTTLYEYLKRHPQVYLPEEKEPNFFPAQVWNAPLHGYRDEVLTDLAVSNWDDYVALFQDAGDRVTGDMSVNTFYYGLPAIQEVKKRLGDIKIVIILRNPVKRAHSAYLHLVRENIETLSFEQSLLYEEIRLRQSHAPIWAYKKASLYAENLQLWMEHFSQVKVMINQDLARQPEKFIREIMEFLEIDPDVEFEQISKQNVTGVPQNKLLHNLLIEDNILKSAIQPVKKVVPTQVWKNMVDRMKNSNLKKPPLAPTTKEYLVDYFTEDVKKVEQLIDRNLSFWLK